MLLELARTRNATPLPLIKTHCGLRLPPERHCLLSANYKLRAAERQPKKLTKSALEKNAKNKSTGSTILKRQANTTKSQTVSIPKPMFKVSGNTNGNSNGAASSGAQPPLTIVNNHPLKLNTEIKMEVEDDYSNDSRGIKRKRDDEDDFEYEEEFETVG